MSDPLVVPARFNGPPDSGNGGYVAGLFAGRISQTATPVEITLRRPPPLDRPMQVEGDDGGFTLTDDGVVAQGRLVELDPDPVEPVSFEEAKAASVEYPGFVFHPFPTCFSCGVDRPDGLRIYPGPVAALATGAGARVAAPWVPDASLEDLRAAAWSALDCVGGWAGDLEERLMVLGQMTAGVDALPAVGEPHVVMGQSLGSQGRKTFTTSTLYDSDARVVGRALHTWIAVDPAGFGSTVR